MSRVTVDPTAVGGIISPELHSQFIEMLGGCINGGIWVGEDSEIENIGGIRRAFVEALREVKPPLIRWPGGCYADTYHWRDGIGPREKRPVTFNENFATYELDDHAFGTDEFMELCRLVGAKPWLNVNLVSGTVQEMKDWMEYCNRRDDTDLARLRAENGHPEPYNVEYWGIGNEPWCGGGYYTAEGYTDAYRKHASAAPSFRHGMIDPDAVPMRFIIAGADGNKPIERVNWTKDVFRSLARYRYPPVYGMDLHFYNWNLTNPKETETDFDESDWYRVIDSCFELEEVLNEQHRLIREGLDSLPAPEAGPAGNPPECRLLVGEWGNWHGCAFAARPALRQQVSMRDAITSALTLDIFHRCCDKVSAACTAQTVNVLNSLFLTEGEHFIKTPNFDVFKMYLPHRGGRAISTEVTEGSGRLYTFASEREELLTLNLVNAAYAEEDEVTISLSGDRCFLSGEILAADSPQACNTAEQPDRVRSREFTAVVPDNGSYTVRLPAASVTVLRFIKTNS